MDCCSACRAVSREDFAFGSGLGGGLGLSFMVATFVEGCDVEPGRDGAAEPGGGRTKDSGRDRRPSRPGRLTDRCSATEPKRSEPKRNRVAFRLTPARCGDPRGQRRTPRRGAGLLAADPAAATND
jgi:hypothetical protein